TGVATDVALSGTGIYDPPATLANRIALSANVSGSGITVNSVTFNSPTSATVNLTAGPGATTGPVTITLVNPDGQTVMDASCATVPVPTSTATVSINDVTLIEGSSGSTTDAVFTVTRSNNSTAFSLTYATANDTAVAPSDYVTVSGTLTFLAGAGQPLTQTISVPVEGDLRVELDESFQLNLGPPSNVSGTTTLSDGQGVGTITNDDSAVVRFNPVAVSESEANSPMAFTVTLSRPVQSGVSLDVDSAFGTATAADFTPISGGSVNFPANNNTAQTVEVTLNNDALIEGDEQFTLTLSNLVATGAITLTNPTATGTILDDDAAQTTTTTISNVAPGTSVTGQSYTVSVNVAGQSSSPTGTVTVSDGAASCGPVALVAGSSPNSTTSCALASTSAGAKTLTASYVPADGSFVASSGTSSHQVNPAATTLSVSGPARSRINQPVSFSFALNVTAPGAGSPAGTVTLSSGAASCMVSVPTATPSCALSLPSLGTQTVSASFVPSNGDFLGSTASGANAASTLVFALADLAISKSDAVTAYRPGDLLVYTIEVDNNGPDTAANFRVLDTVPAELINVSWTCAASGGVSCPQASGTGDLNETIASMASAATLIYTLSGNVSGTPGQISNTASLALPADTTVEDPVAGNNSATDVDQIDFLFMNGFETTTLAAGSGSQTIPVLALLGDIGVVAEAVYALEDAQGMAVHVYVRVVDEQANVALAQRGHDGLLRLGPWLRITSDPVLSWRASETVDGWVLDSAALAE
ncbi:MAG: DUF11 domain-containing protein, partial [Xanthomonadales bacterium]|nr:DUF11 domain-containing protein [Xanthomonadales bacterium]